LLPQNQNSESANARAAPRISSLPSIRAYVINLDGAAKRWSHVQKIFAEAEITFSRVPAINGKMLELEPSIYSEAGYLSLHGRKTNPPEVGCYLSHLRAMRSFLDTDSELALICEDDISFGPELVTVIMAILSLPRFWNLLRLSGLSEGCPLKIQPLGQDAWLCINLGRVKGAGAYLIDRKGAQVLVDSLLPMKLPFDHALDREWCHRLIAASIIPYPVNQIQKRFGSSIQTYAQPKLSTFRRWLTTYPYQASNEIMRWLSRSTLFVAVKLRSLRWRDQSPTRT
jgi:glycosyl transferase family 25